MALRKIIIYPNPVLREKSRMVDVVDNHIRVLLDDMAQTMYHSKIGAGLAACQIGVLKRLVVIDMGDKRLYKLVLAQGEQEVIEGCLSFPNRWGKLKRPEKVVVKALNEWGREIKVTGQGNFAKCLCHEIDHLDGVLLIDRIIGSR